MIGIIRDSRVREFKQHSQMCPALLNSTDTSNSSGEGLEFSSEGKACLETSPTIPESNRLAIKSALSSRQDSWLLDLNTFEHVSYRGWN